MTDNQISNLIQRIENLEEENEKLWDKIYRLQERCNEIKSVKSDVELLERRVWNLE